jgi:collagen type IV alpha-3-binding protein
LQLKLNELETFKSILNEQISTLQQYFDACAANGGAQNLETDHGLQAVDFKGEALTFRETTSAVLTTLK